MKHGRAKIAAIVAAVVVATAVAVEAPAGKNAPHLMVYTEAPALVGASFLLVALTGRVAD